MILFLFSFIITMEQDDFYCLLADALESISNDTTHTELLAELFELFSSPHAHTYDIHIFSEKVVHGLVNNNPINEDWIQILQEALSWVLDDSIKGNWDVPCNAITDYDFWPIEWKWDFQLANTTLTPRIVSALKKLLFLVEWSHTSD